MAKPEDIASRFRNFLYYKLREVRFLTIIKNFKNLVDFSQKLTFFRFPFEMPSELLENALRALSDKTSSIIK